MLIFVFEKKQFVQKISKKNVSNDAVMHLKKNFFFIFQ